MMRNEEVGIYPHPVLPRGAQTCGECNHFPGEMQICIYHPPPYIPEWLQNIPHATLVQVLSMSVACSKFIARRTT